MSTSPNDLRNVSFDHDNVHTPPTGNSQTVSYLSPHVHHNDSNTKDQERDDIIAIVRPSFDDEHDTPPPPTKNTTSKRTTKPLSKLQLSNDQVRSPEQEHGREENHHEKRSSPPPSPFRHDGNNDDRVMFISRYGTDVSDQGKKYDDSLLSDIDRRHRGGGLEILSSAVVADGAAAETVVQDGIMMIDKRPPRGSRIPKKNIHIEQRMNSIDIHVPFVVHPRREMQQQQKQYPNHFSGNISHSIHHPALSHYQHHMHPFDIQQQQGVNRMGPPPPLPVLNQHPHQHHVRHPSLQHLLPQSSYQYQQQHGYYGHYRHSSYPPTPTSSYHLPGSSSFLPTVASHNSMQQHSPMMQEHTDTRIHHQDVNLSFNDSKMQDDELQSHKRDRSTKKLRASMLKVHDGGNNNTTPKSSKRSSQTSRKQDHSKKVRASVSEIHNGNITSTQTSNRSSQTFVTAIAIGNMNRTIRSSSAGHQLKHVATNTKANVLMGKGETMIRTPSNRQLGDIKHHHHRKNSSFSSLGLGNILGGPVLSPHDNLKETPPSSDQKQQHPLLKSSSPPMSENNKEMVANDRHHRSTSSSSFLNVLDSIVGRDNDVFLRNLHQQQKSSPSPSPSSGLSPMSTSSEEKTRPLKSIRCKINYDETDNNNSENVVEGKLALGGTSKRVRRKCTVDGCRNRVVQGGLCITHGARRKTCQHIGCMKNVKKAGFCSTHGPARKRCDVNGCHKVAVQKNKCVSHGAIKKLCNYNQHCLKQAILNGKCKKHYDIHKKNIFHNDLITSSSSPTVLYCTPCDVEEKDEEREEEMIDTITIPV